MSIFLKSRLANDGHARQKSNKGYLSLFVKASAFRDQFYVCPVEDENFVFRLRDTFGSSRNLPLERKRAGIYRA